MSAPIIERGYAEYTQIIHTSFIGMRKKTGDVDIFINYISDIKSGLINLHALSVYVHIATSTKRLYLIGEENGAGSIIANTGRPVRAQNQTESLVGVYGKFETKKYMRKFDISLTTPERVNQFWNALGEFGSDDIFGSVVSLI